MKELTKSFIFGKPKIDLKQIIGLKPAREDKMAMDMKIAILLGTRSDFFEPVPPLKSFVNRRGMLSFPAISIKEADEIITKVPSVSLVIVDGVTRNENGTKLALDVKELERLVDRWPDLRFIFLVPQIGAVEMPPTDRARIVHEPFNHKTLALMTRRLIGIPERTYFKTLTQFKRLAETNPKGLFGFSVNIEPTGLLLQTETSLQIGEAVGLSFIPPNGGRNVEVKGLVVRETESPEKGTKRFGIKLVDVPPTLKEAIKEFCLPKSQL